MVLMENRVLGRGGQSFKPGLLVFGGFMGRRIFYCVMELVVKLIRLAGIGTFVFLTSSCDIKDYHDRKRVLEISGIDLSAGSQLVLSKDEWSRFGADGLSLRIYQLIGKNVNHPCRHPGMKSEYFDKVPKKFLLIEPYIDKKKPVCYVFIEDGRSDEVFMLQGSNVYYFFLAY